MAASSATGTAGFIGNSLGEAAAFAAGLAIGPVLEPVLQELRNETWQQYPSKPLDPALLASGVAEMKLNATTGQNEAALTGISSSAFTSLVAIMQTAPSVAEGLDLIRRGQLSASEFVTILQRAGLEANWLTAYQNLANNNLNPWEQPLDPSAIALGIVRSTLPSQGLLVVDLDTGGSNVAQYTPAALDVIAEAAASGIDEDRLRTLVGNVGLPLAAEAAARAEFRGIITKGAFYQAILEGDTRPEWADSIYEAAREILTPHEYAELYLRGWIDQTTMYAGTALRGMSQADSDLLVENIGRPLAVHQVTTGLARGGTFGGFYADVPDPYLSAIRESNIRPEWGNLAYANRYTYPSGFEVKAEAQAGTLSTADTNTLLLEMGWDPKWAQFFADAWTGGTTTTGKKLTAAQIKAAWKVGSLTSAQAVADLVTLGYSQANAQLIFDGWTAAETTTAPVIAPPTGG
jgi:hypothetical protein